MSDIFDEAIEIMKESVMEQIKNNSAFTNDDVKLMEELIGAMEKLDPQGYVSQRLPLLLSRLKAVERYATKIREGREGWFNSEYEAWRKACRK